jgi:hypothetical protein
MGASKGRGIIDAVSDHGDLVALLPTLDELCLLIGQELRLDLGYSNTLGNRLSHDSPVTGEKRDLFDAGLAQFGDDSGRFGADPIADSDSAEDISIPRNQDRCLSGSI